MSEETEAYLAVKSIDILQASCKSSTLTFTGVKIKRADAAGMRSHRDTGTFSRRGALYQSKVSCTQHFLKLMSITHLTLTTRRMHICKGGGGGVILAGQCRTW